MKIAMFTLCATTFLAAQGLIKPIWVNQVPSEPGKVYGVGLAQIAATEAMAVKQAGNNARAEVLTRLRATVKSTTDVRQTMTEQRSAGAKATATGTRTFDQATSVQASATELPGLTVEETWTDRKENTVYALAYLDVAVAQRELRLRFDAQQDQLASETTSGDPRERLRKLRRLQDAQKEMVKLDDMAGLLAAAGGDAALRSDVRKVKLYVDKLLDQLRASLTFSVEGQATTGLGGDVASLLRNAVLKAGLGWVEKNGEFTLVLDIKGSRQGVNWTGKTWWERTHNADTVVSRGILEVTLRDKAGTQYESTSIDGKGVHPNEMMADKLLLDELRKKLSTTLEKWLVEITK